MNVVIPINFTSNFHQSILGATAYISPKINLYSFQSLDTTFFFFEYWIVLNTENRDFVSNTKKIFLRKLLRDANPVYASEKN